MLDWLKNRVGGGPPTADRIEPALGLVPSAPVRSDQLERRALEAATPRRPIPGDHGGDPYSWSGIVSAGMQTVKARSRHFRHSDPWYGNGIAGIVDHVVGCGVVPASMADDENFRTAAGRAWASWCDRADAAGETDAYGLQARSVDACATDGESLILFESAPDGELRLRLLSSDQLDASMTRDINAAAGHAIINGVEFLAGQRVAYWLKPTTGPSLSLSTAAVRVPASEVCHLRRPGPAGEVRGLSWGASCLLGLNELAQLTDAMAIAAKCASMLMAFAVDQNTTGPNPFLGDGQQIGNLLQGGLEPGTIKVLPSGWDIKFSQPATWNAGIQQAQLGLRAVSAGLGVPEYVLTGDLSQANYSSLRSARLAFKRRCERFTFHALVPLALRPIWNRFLVTEILAGRLPLPSGDPRNWLAVEWYPPAWESVDAEKDAQADNLALASGLASRRQLVAARGYDVAVLDAEIAADHQREQRLGLNFTYQPQQQRAAND